MNNIHAILAATAALLVGGCCCFTDGAKTDAEGLKALETRRKSGVPGLAAATVSARDFYDPDFMYRSSYNPSFAIVKGKELIQKWV